MQKKEDRIRAYVLARELNLGIADLLDVCHKLDIELKNQLSTLTPEQRDAVVQHVRRGSSAATTVVAPPPPPKPPTISSAVGGRVRDLRSVETIKRPPQPPTRVEPPVPLPPREPVLESQQPVETPPPEEPKVAELDVAAPVQEPPRTVEPLVETPPPAVVAETPPSPPPPPPPPTPAPPPTTVVAPPPPVVSEPAPPPVAAPEPPVAPTPPSRPVAPPAPPPPVRTPPPTLTPPVSAPPMAPPVTASTSPPESGAPRPPDTRPGLGMPPTVPGRMRNLGAPGGPPREGGSNRPKQPPSRPGGPRVVQRTGPVPGGNKPPVSKPDDKKTAPPSTGGVRKLMDLPEDVKQGERTITAKELLSPGGGRPPGTGAPGTPGALPILEGDDAEGDEDSRDKKKKSPGAVAGRHDRHEKRERARVREKGGREAEQVRAATGLIEEDRPRRGRRHGKPQHKGPATKQRKGKIPISLPITVRALSEAIGIRSAELCLKLMGQGIKATINTTLDPVTAETIALEYGCELDVKSAPDAEKDLLATTSTPDRPEDLVPRAPIVTIMGHVDHGKTSLLDKIRESNVVDTEAGGITQVIRAWRVDHGGRPITFLDTPGHEAFTKMRARGANVTDIVVIVVAADDGVMPQTEEAISHARAAGVPIVVAINKIDMASANIERTRRQLYSLELIPDNMGGEVPFVHTSAAKGVGIDELLDQLSVVAELKELKANPNKPAVGRCLEAMLTEGEGVMATVLVQDGTLRRGDIVLCGATHGRVRAMYNDLGKPIQEAGPSVPVRITGLESVPNADDPFQVVPDLATAREIADKRAIKAQELAAAARGLATEDPWERLKPVEELKVILKADFRGSIEAIKKELEKLTHEEVRVRVLLAGIGGITENDVQLALTSPEDTMVVGFNAVPDERAMALAEERGVQIHEYDIIYNLTNDIRAALEGKLKPHEQVVHLGRAVVRETFKISRTGTIAGCYVTQGTIERSAKVRLIRQGIVVFPPADRTASLESLRRFKDDVREVQQGYECGIKIAGYDDIKVDDVIEAYRIEQVLRKLT